MGSPNKPVLHAAASLTRCPACGSTERAPYSAAPHEQASRGLTPDGEPFTHIIRRRTSCLNCGQCRIDRAYENRLGGK